MYNYCQILLQTHRPYTHNIFNSVSVCNEYKIIIICRKYCARMKNYWSTCSSAREGHKEEQVHIIINPIGAKLLLPPYHNIMLTVGFLHTYSSQNHCTNNNVRGMYVIILCLRLFTIIVGNRKMLSNGLFLFYLSSSYYLILLYVT